MNTHQHKVLFINGGSKKFGTDFREACNEQGVTCLSFRAVHTVLEIYNNTLYFWVNGENIAVNDAMYAFIRVKGKSTHMLSLIATYFRLTGVEFNDGEPNVGHTKSDEKISQMIRYCVSGIPIPNGFIVSYRSYYKNREAILERVVFPCVLKAGGSKGDCVWKIESIQELEEKMEHVDDELLMIQELIPNSHDIRALMFEGELLGAIKRSSVDGFYNNLAKAGKAEKVELKEQELECAKKACRVVGIDFGGVDIVRTDSGPMIFEINKGPQVYGLERVLGISVGHELVNRIIRRFDDVK